MHGVKAKWELYKNTMCRFEQILEAAPHLPLISQTIKVRPPKTYLNQFGRPAGSKG